MIRHKYKGHRLFKHDNEKNIVIQIVVDPGERKTGRPHMIGMYRISEVTFTANYRPYAKQTTQRLFLFYVDIMLIKLMEDE